MPGHPTTLDNSRARVYWACSRCEWGFWDFFLSPIFSLSFLPLKTVTKNPSAPAATDGPMLVKSTLGSVKKVMGNCEISGKIREVWQP